MPVLTSTVTVLLVDDHPVVREGLHTVLSADPVIELVGEASTGEEALEMLERLRPQVVLLDVQLPGMNGLDTLRAIKQRSKETAVVMLTVYDSEMYFIEAMRCGANGYLMKDAQQELISLAIRSAACGGCMVNMRMVAATAQRMRLPIETPPDPEVAKITSKLTPRELDVLRMLARGLQNRAISERLHLAEVTVKKYVQVVVAKIGVPDRTRAALLGARLGLGD